MYLIFLLLGVVHGKTIGDYSENYLKWNIVDGVIPDNLAADRGCDRELQLSTSRPSKYVPISCADIRYSVYDKHAFSLDPQKVDVSRKYSVKLSAYDNGVCNLNTAVPHVDTTFHMYQNGKISPFLNRYGYCDGTMDAPTLLDEIVITTESCDDSGYAIVKTRDECTAYSGASSLVPEVSDANRPFGCNDGKFNSFDRTTASDQSVVAGYKSDRAAEIEAEYNLLVLDVDFDGVPTFTSGVNTSLLDESSQVSYSVTTTTSSYDEIEIFQYCRDSPLYVYERTNCYPYGHEDAVCEDKCSGSDFVSSSGACCRTEAPEKNGRYIAYQTVTTYCGWQECSGDEGHISSNDVSNNSPSQRLQNCYESCAAINYPYFWITTDEDHVPDPIHKLGRCVCFKMNRLGTSDKGPYYDRNDYYKISYQTNTVNEIRGANAVERLDRRLENIANQIMSMWDKVIYYNKLTDYMTALNVQMKTARTVLLRMGELNKLYKYYTDGDIDGYNDIASQTEASYTTLKNSADQYVYDLNVDVENNNLKMLLGDDDETYDSLYNIYSNYTDEYKSANTADKCAMNAKHRYRTTVIGCIPDLDFSLECIPDDEYYENAPAADCFKWQRSGQTVLKHACATTCDSHTTTYHTYERLFHIYTSGNRVDDIYNNADYDQWKQDNPLDDFNNLTMWHSDPNTLLSRTDIAKTEEYEFGSSATQHGFRFITDAGVSLISNNEGCPYDSFCALADAYESYKIVANQVIYNDDGSETHTSDYLLRYSYSSRVTMMDLRSIYDNMKSLTFGGFDDAPTVTSTAAAVSLPITSGRIGLVNQKKNEIFVKEIEHLTNDKTSKLNALYDDLSKLNIACGTPCREGDECLDFTAELTIPEFTGEFVDELNPNGGPVIRGYIYLGASSTTTVHPRREGDRLFFSAQSEKDNDGTWAGPVWGVFTDLSGAVIEKGSYDPTYSNSIPTTMSATFKALDKYWGYSNPYGSYTVEDKVSIGNFQSSRSCLRELCYDQKYSSEVDAKAGCHAHCQHTEGLRVYWDPSEPREATRVYDHKAFECSCGEPLDEFECVMSGKQWKSDIKQTQYRYEPADPVATKNIVPVTTYLYCPLSHCTQGYVDKKCGRGDQGACSRGSWFNGACIAPGQMSFCKNEFVEEECMCHTETCKPGYYCTKAGECKPVVRKDKKMLQVRYNYLEQS